MMCYGPVNDIIMLQNYILTKELEKADAYITIYKLSKTTKEDRIIPSMKYNSWKRCTN